MYECCNVKRFLRLLVLDAIIFSLCFIFLFIGKNIAFSAENDEKITDVSLYAVTLDSAVGITAIEDILSYLEGNDYNILSAAELKNFIADPEALPENSVIFSADDNSEHAVYLLEKYGIQTISQEKLLELCESSSTSINIIDLKSQE